MTLRAGASKSGKARRHYACSTAARVGEADLEPAIIAGEQIGKGIRGFIRKWRAAQDKTANTYLIEIAL